MVKVGELIALTVESGEDWKSVEMPDGVSAGGSPSSGAATPQAQTSAPASSEPPPAGQ